MHEEEVDIGGVVDEEGFMAGGHHMASFLVRTIADLDCESKVSPYSPRSSEPPMVCRLHLQVFLERSVCFLLPSLSGAQRDRTYRWHSSLSLEPSSDTIVDALWLPPARVDAHEAVTLVAAEALRACIA